MATTTDSTTAPANAEIRVTVEQGNQPIEISTKKLGLEQKGGSKTGDAAQSSLNQILSSLAETRKYLPSQVYTFLDSMEGKTVDDLRIEAMHLANKAQEEAKKRTDDVKAVVGNANNKVQDAADAARTKTTDIANNLAQKSIDIVQPPIDRTKEATMSIANKVNDTTTGIVSRNLERARNLAMQGYTMTSERLRPVIQPVAVRASVYLPAPAQTFLKENVEGKSLEQLYGDVVKTTRKNLLSVRDETEPTLRGLVGEFKDATLSGEVFRNSLNISEKAADNLFGKTEVPMDASALRRMFNLSNKVTGGVRNYANSVTQQVLDVFSTRTNQYRAMAMQQVNPVLDRIRSTPLIPNFVFRLLRGEATPKEMPGFGNDAGQGLEMESKAQVTTLPATSVRIDMIGVKPAGEAKVTTGTASIKSSEMKGLDAQGTEAVVSSSEAKNTNAQDMGSMGDAGMVGDEDKTATEEGDAESQSKGKKKKHSKP